MRTYLFHPVLFYRQLRRRSCSAVPFVVTVVGQTGLLFLPGVLNHVSFTLPLAVSIAVFSFVVVSVKCFLSVLFFGLISSGTEGRQFFIRLKFFFASSIFCHAPFIAGKMISGMYGWITWFSEPDSAFQFVRFVHLRLLLDYAGIHAPPILEQMDLFAILFIVHSAAVLKSGSTAAFGLLMVLSAGHWLVIVSAQKLLLRSLTEW